MVIYKDGDIRVLHLRHGNFTEAFRVMTDYFLNDGFENEEKKLDLKISGYWNREDISQLSSFASILECYASKLEYEKTIRTHTKRRQSVFRALILTAPFNGNAAWGRILRNQKIMSIFKAVHFYDRYMFVEDRDEIPAETMRVVEDLVGKRCIKELTFRHCRLSTSNTKLFAKMIESNLLESLQFLQSNLDQPALACGLLSESLKNLPRQPHKTISSLEELFLDEVLLDMFDLDGNSEGFFSAMVNLQNLRRFGLHTNKPGVLRTLGNYLKEWKRVHCLKILVSRQEAEWDFQALFRAIELSSVRDFLLHRHGFGSNLPAIESTQLFDLAFSTKSQLVDIDIGCINPSLLSSLIPKINDKGSLRPHVRTFRFLDDGDPSRLLEDDDHQRRLENLQALLDLVKTQLPFLHNICRMIDDQMENCSEELEEGSPELALWTQILEQMEKNKVGMALLDLPASVPRGLWAYVLEQKAFSYTKRDDASMTRNYQLIQALCKTGLLGVSEDHGAAAATVVSGSKRRRHT